MDKPIQITEQDLHMLVEDAVRNYLKEERVDEFFGGMGSMFGAAKNAMQAKYQNTKQGIQNLGQNMANTYRQGNYNNQIQKMGNDIIARLNNFVKLASQLSNAELVSTGTQCSNAIRNAMAQSQQKLQNVQANTFSTKNPNQGM
jgi:hypothetical protein